MPEELTLPDEHLARQIRAAAAQDSLGHAVIISGQGDLSAAARYIAAAMQCEGHTPPCGQCGPCRKIIREIHPDFITVDDPEHKNIAVDILREKVADAYILPNEGKRKIYLFPDCSRLDPKAQNVLLKVLEEGPDRSAFLFCAENSSVLLPTIRSRAVEWKLPPAAGRVPSENAQQLCQLLCRGQKTEIVAFCVKLENSKLSREELRDLLSGTRDLLAAGLAACYTPAGSPLARQLAGQLGKYRLAAHSETVADFLRQCSYNVSVGHLAGALAAALTA
ncbi:MAG: DNA polymerase III subunit delta' [Oscillospiraceae bacterium]|nr:DNA polymerase III subunit delta' [Oscillospiraceae bacterium]